MYKIVLEENNVESLKNPMNEEMEKIIKHFERELVKIRTGRAHTSVIEDVPVVCYGQSAVPLKSIATLAAPESRLLTIQPWDKNIIADIEKAILVSDVGITPVNDGTVVRLQLPEMSSTRREELVKILNKNLESCKIGIRNVRKEFNNCIRDAKTSKTISENFYNRLCDLLQEVTDNFCEKAELASKKKQKEITTI